MNNTLRKSKENNPIIVLVNDMFVQPFVIDGNHRIRKALESGIYKVEVYVLNADNVIHCLISDDYRTAFDDIRKIVIDRIKFKILLFTPFDSFRQGIVGTTGPENEIVAIFSPFLEISNQCQIGRSAVGPLAIAQSAIEIYGNSFEVDCVIINGMVQSTNVSLC